MTPEERITAWLRQEAPPSAPDRVLEATFAQTRRISRRRSPLDWRTDTMQRRWLAPSVVALAAVAVVGLAVVLLPRDRDASGGVPVAPPATASAPGSPDPSASGPPATATGSVAFHASVAGNTDIYVADGDGSDVTRLTTDPSQEVSPAWSPDGRSIAFIRDGDVFIMAADGSDPRRLTSTPEDEAQPSFSPDGTRIVFSRAMGEDNWPVYSIGLDGADEQLLLELPKAHLESNARLIEEDVLVVLQDLVGGGGLEVAQVDLTAGTTTLLTDHRDGEDGTFAISADGGQLAFQSDRSPAGIWVKSLGEAEESPVTNATPGGVAWTADGSTLSYADADGWINLIRPDGTGRTRLVEGSNPEWRPAP